MKETSDSEFFTEEIGYLVRMLLAPTMYKQKTITGELKLGSQFRALLGI